MQEISYLQSTQESYKLMWINLKNNVRPSYPKIDFKIQLKKSYKLWNKGIALDVPQYEYITQYIFCILQNLIYKYIYNSEY